MRDLIERQAAIRKLKRMATQAYIDKLNGKAETIINCCIDVIERQIPSAQPKIEERKEESAQNVPKEDLISRNAAIDAECEVCQIAPKKERGHNCTYYVHGCKEIECLRALPSAQPEPIRINLNEPIKVKLTDWGKEIYYHKYDRTNQIAGREICKPRFPREDENGYTEFQLWCFIELYGMHMGMTLPNVIEPLEIVYER